MRRDVSPTTSPPSSYVSSKNVRSFPWSSMRDGSAEVWMKQDVMTVPVRMFGAPPSSSEPFGRPIFRSESSPRLGAGCDAA